MHQTIGWRYCKNVYEKLMAHQEKNKLPIDFHHKYAKVTDLQARTQPAVMLSSEQLKIK